MGRLLQTLSVRLTETWANATIYDVAFATAWVVLISYLVARTSQSSAVY